MKSQTNVLKCVSVLLPHSCVLLALPLHLWQFGANRSHFITLYFTVCTSTEIVVNAHSHKSAWTDSSTRLSSRPLVNLLWLRFAWRIDRRLSSTATLRCSEGAGVLCGVYYQINLDQVAHKWTVGVVVMTSTVLGISFTTPGTEVSSMPAFMVSIVTVTAGVRLASLSDRTMAC